MTENNTLKRRVRARMAKTGERYTAARRQVLDKAPAGASPTEVPPAATGAPATIPATDEPLHGPTDRTWSQWVAILDEWGARDKPHPDIARWLGEKQGVPPWWTQDITVRYEKHIGRRVLGQRGSTFSATASKTINVADHTARAAWLDVGKRARWLPDVELKRRPNRVAIASRFDAPEGRVIVSFDPRGPAKVSVAIEHEKLPDAKAAARWTAFWRERLRHLKEMLESAP